MKITKLNKRLTGAVACAMALFIGMTPMTAFAHTGPEAECTCETKCTEDCVNEECPVCKEDISLCQGEEKPAEPEEKEEEKMGPLTPDGNLTLVDDYGSVEAGGKQFITVVTKKGNYFYIIIDRDDNGTETVHFLNMVDEADLLALMDEDEQKALQESLESAEKEEVTKETVEETVVPVHTAIVQNTIQSTNAVIDIDSLMKCNKITFKINGKTVDMTPAELVSHFTDKSSSKIESSILKLLEILVSPFLRISIS